MCLFIAILEAKIKKDNSPNSRRTKYYGLRFFAGRESYHLLQIGGGGGLFVGSSGRQFWCRPPAVSWEVYEAAEGQIYDTRAQAALVAGALEEAARRRVGKRSAVP
jgi:hypothetical protein